MFALRMAYVFIEDVNRPGLVHTEGKMTSNLSIRGVRRRCVAARIYEPGFAMTSIYYSIDVQ